MYTVSFADKFGSFGLSGGYVHGFAVGVATLKLQSMLAKTASCQRVGILIFTNTDEGVGG